MDLLDDDLVLLDGGGQLLVGGVVDGRELHDLGLLSLARVLKGDVLLVGGVQGHLELGDGHGHLLLHVFDFDLEITPRDSLDETPRGFKSTYLESGFRLLEPDGQALDLHHQLLLDVHQLVLLLADAGLGLGSQPLETYNMVRFL